MLLEALAFGAVVVLGTRLAAAEKVQFRERAAGVHPYMQQLLDLWNREGTHVVVVAGGPAWPYPGGLRLDPRAQEAAAASGLSNASTLKDTAHGRGGALDIWPEAFDPNRGFADQPGMKQQMSTFGLWAESKGYEWGGRWVTRDKPDGDMPHVQMRDWRSLPFPPPDYRGVA